MMTKVLRQFARLFETAETVPSEFDLAYADRVRKQTALDYPELLWVTAGVRR